jgi:fibronectin-binding autotransporter adhesin
MQSIRNRGTDRAEHRESAMARRQGLFSTTALIPAIAALAGGAMMAAPGQAQAQTVVTSGAAANGFGENSLCLDAALDLCPIDLGAIPDASPPAVHDLSTGSAGRSLLTGGGETSQIQVTGGVSLIGSGTSNNSFELAGPSQTFQVTTGNSWILNGIISDFSVSAGLEKIGDGNLTLAGNNSYSGGTIVSAGDLQISSDGNLGAASGGVTLRAGARLVVTSSFATNRTFTMDNAGNFRVESGVTLTLNGQVIGTGALATVGPGTLVLTGNNSYSGSTSIASGTLEVRDGGTLGTSFVNNSATLAFNNASAMSVGNAILGSGAVTKSGAGTLTLTGSNSYTGATTVNAGTLVVGNASALGTTAGSTTVASGATLGVQGSLTGFNEAITLNGTGVADGGALRNLSGNNTISGAITLGSASQINSDAGLLFLPNSITGANHALTFAGAGNFTLNNALSLGSGQIIKTGTGTLTFDSGVISSGTTGGLLLSQGTLSLRTSLGAGFGTIRTTGSVIDYGNLVNIAAPILLDSNTTQLQVTTGRATQSGDISETGGARPIEKTGAGRLELAGNNSYSGGTTISAGALAFNSDANLGAASGGITIGNASLQLGTQTFVSPTAVTTNRAISLTGSAGINVQSNGTLTLGGPITGTGSLSKAFGGTLVLTGSNSYAGTTAVNFGTLQVGDGGTTGTLGAGAVTVASTLVFNRSNDFTVANDIGGGGALTKAGGGTLTLTGAKTYAGLTSVTGGTLVFDGTSAYTGGGVLDVNGGNFTLGVDATFSEATQTGNTVVALGGRTMTLLTGNYSLNGGSITGPGTIDIRNNNRGLLINTASAAIGADVTINGAGGGTPFVQLNMSADYSLLPTITGANLQLRLFNTDSRTTVSGNNSFGGGTVLSTGTVVVASDTALGTGTLTMAANTGLEAGGTGDRTLANAITLNGIGTSITNPNANSNFTLSGIIGGSNRLTKFGAGTVILTGANAYSGGTTVAGGTLQIGSGSLAGSLGTGSVTIGTNGTLAFNSSASQNVNNSLGGAGALIKAGSGMLTLGGTNTFTGPVSLDGGSLQLTGGSAFGDSAALTMAAGTALGVDTSETIGSLSGNGTVVLQAGAVLTTGGNNNSSDFAGALSGLGGLTKTGTGTFTLTGTSNFLGTTTISGGTLQIGNNTTTGAINGGPIVNNASLVFNRSNNIDSNVAISGTGSLTKQGAGTLTLLASNTYSGGTTVSAGILQLGSGSTTGSLGTGGVTISSGATLQSNSSATQTIAGALAGNGSLVQQGTGTTILSAAANGYSGTAQIFAGTLQLDSTTALGTGAVQMRGGSLHLASAGTYGNNINSFTADGNVVSTAASSTVTLTGQIGGAGTLRLAPGTGSTLDIASSSASAGATTRIIVQSGTVRAQNGVLGLLLTQTDTQTQVDTGAVLDFNTRLSSIANLTGAGTILNAGSTTTLRNGTFSGAFNGTQSLATTGTISLSGNSSFSGTTTVQSGTLTIGSNTALGNSTGGTTVASGATLQFSGTPLTIGDALTISGTGNGGIGAIRVAPLGASGNEATSLTGGVTLAADSTITVADRNLLSFNTGGIALGSSTLTFASEGTGNSSIFVNSAISGTGGLVKTGSGLLRLNGNNGFTGPLTINGGDVVLASGTALADTVAVSMATGARLFVSSTETIGSLAGAGTVSFENASVLTTGGNNASTTFAGIFNGTGNLTKTGTGTFTLTGTSSFAGLTTVSGGTLQIGDGGTAGAIGSGQIVTNANLAFNRSDALAITNAISGFGTLTKLGAGTLTLSGANSYSGGTTISAGTLVLDQVAGGTIGAAGTGTITLENNSALLSNVTGTLANRINITSTTSASIGAAAGTTLALSGNQFETSSPVTLTFGSSTATGLIELAAPSGVSVAAGTTSTIAGGTVRTGNAFAASIFSLASGGTTIGTGTTAATLDVNGLSFQLVNLTGSASGTLTNLGSQAATATLNTQIASVFDGVITNGASALNLVKTGSGTLSLTGTNTYSGTTTVTAGTLNVGRAGTSGTLGSGAVIVGAAGRLLLNRTNDLLVTNAISGAGEVIKGSAGTTTLTGDNSGYTGTLSVTNGTLQIGNGGTTGSLGTGAVANDATLAINLASDITLAQAITGNGALRKLGSGVTTISGNVTQGSATVEAGTLALSGSNSFTNGITVAGGTLSLRSANAAGGATGLIRTTGSVIDYADGLTMATPIELNSNTTQLQVLAGSATQSGVISEIGGARPLEKIGAGTLTLSATNSYSGGTTISAGRLNITSNANLGAIAGGLTIGNAVLGTTGLISSARAVSLTGAAGIDVSSSSLTLTGAVAGAGSLTKTGNGQLVLTADNSYAGTTTISGSGGLTVGTGGTTGTLGSGNITVNAGSFLAFSRSDAFTVANAISGQGNVGKQSSGTLTLSGANTFSGGLAIGAGTVALASANAGVITAAGTGNITFSSNTTLRTDVSGTLGNNLFFGNGSSTVAAATGTTLRLASNVLSFEAGAGSPLNFGTASATGTIELAPVTVSVGAQVNPIAINGGTLRLANTGAFTLLNGANGVSLNGATLGADVAGTLTKVLTIGATGGTIDVAAASLTLEGANTYTGVLTKTGTGELRLTGAGTGSGTVQLNAGSLALLASNAGWGTGTLQMATGTTLRLGAPSPATLANAVVLGAGAGSTIIASSTTFSGALSGGDLTIAAGLGADGPSVVRLTGTNSYGATTIGAGNTLQIGTTGTGGTLGTGNVTVNAGATLRFSGNDLTIANVVSGAGQLVRDGLGTTTLTGANSYAGGTVISGGGIVIGNAGALGSGGLTMSGTSSLTTAAGISATVSGLTIGNFANSSISAASGQTLALGGTLDFSNFASSLVFGTTTRTGTVQIGFAPATGSNSSASIRVDAGTLRLAAASEDFLLRAGGGLTINGSGTLDLNGFAGGGVNLRGAGAITNASATAAQFTASQSAATTFSGIIGGGPGAISLVKSGTGALTLTGANTYTGATSITGGSLQIGDGGTTGSLGTGNVSIASGTELLLNRSDALSLANVFTGAGTVQKNLANTLTLTGSNTASDGFTGTFNVNAGTLLVNGTLGDLTNRAATVNIASGAALGGSGTIQGNVVVANGGILSPGNSPATQTIAGNLTLNDSSVLNFELAQAGIVGSGINDLINVGGNLVLDGTLNVTALDGFGAGFYRLLNYGGTLTNNTLNIGTAPLGFTSELRTDIAGQVNILFNAGAQTVQYWDGADLTGATATVNGEGGAGVWTSSATNWTTPTGFAVNSAWAGQAGVFAGAAGGTVQVIGNQAFQELRFLTNGYVLNSAGATDGLATTGGFSIINTDTGVSTVINTPISGTAGLIKTGGGSLSLGGANSYAGQTTISGGTLSLLGGGAIAGAVQNNATLTNAGTISGLVTNAGTLTSTGTLAGGLTNNAGAAANVAGGFGGSAITNSGTLTLTGATTGIGAVTQNVGGVFNLANISTGIGSLAGSGAVQLGSATLTTGSDNASTNFSGVLSGTGALTKIGTGTFTLAGANAYSGLTTVNGGTLVIDAAGRSGGAVVNNAQLVNAGTVSGFVTNNGNFTSTGSLTGLINSAGAIAQISGQFNAGGVSNNGQLTFAGATSGISSITNTGSITFNTTLANPGQVAQTATGSMNLNGFDQTFATLTGSGTIQLGSAVLSIGGSNASNAFGGTISGTGGLTKSGFGTVTLTAANTFTGTTTISGGSLELTNTAQLAGAVQNNSVLLNSGAISGLVTNTGTVISGGRLFGGLTNVAGANATISGTLNGPVANSGTITLNGTSSGSAELSQAAGGTLNLAGFNATIRSLAGAGAVQLGSGNLSLSGNGISTTFSGVISGSGNLTKLGTGTLTLSGANSFTGLTTINLGSISLATGASLAGAVQNNATFINAGSVAGQVTNAGSLISAGTLAGGLVNNAGASASLANTVNGAITNSGTITLTAGLSGSPSFTQSTGASLNLAGFSATLGSIAGTGAIQLGSGTLTAGASGASTSFDGVISGSGTFNKAGSGTLTLGGSNTAESNFTGTVNVNAGSLVLNGQFGDVVANSANLTLANGATLGGSGSFLGNLSLGAGAILGPGNSPATIAIGGNLLLDSASVLNFELAQPGVVGSGINDLITVGGNLTLDGTLNVTALTGFGEGIYRLINYGGTLTDNGLLVGTRPDGFTASLITNIGGQISVQFTQGVPTVLYWDGTDTTAASSAINGNGGPGIWNSTNTNWTAAPGFSTAFPWNSQTGVFAGAAGGTVQVSGIQAFQQLRFETNNYVLNAAAGGGGLSTIGGESIVDVAVPGQIARINAAIQGTGGLTKIGTGTLSLGGANTYTGTTTVANGILTLDTAARLAGPVINRTQIISGGSIDGSVTNSGRFRSSGTVNGALDNSGGAEISGTLNGSVTNSNLVDIIGNVTGIGAFNQTSARSAFNLAGFNTTIGSLAGIGTVSLGNGTLTVGGDNSSTIFAGVISGNGGLTKVGGGSFMLTGSNRYTGLTTNSSGTLLVANGGLIAGSVLNNSTFGNFGIVSGQVQNNSFFNNNGVVRGLFVNDGLLQTSVTLLAGLTNNSGGTVQASGLVNGNVTNAGSITLTGTTFGIGALNQAGGTLNLAGFSTSIGSLAGTGSVQLGSGTLTVGSNNLSTAFSGSITGTGGLIKTGAGTLTLSGNNSYTGLTTIAGGSLVLANGGLLAGAVQNNASFINNGSVQGLITNAGNLRSTGTLAGGLTNNAFAIANLSGVLSGNLINRGTVNLIGTTTGIAELNMTAGAAFNLGGFATTIGNLTGGGGTVALGSATLTLGSGTGSQTFDGTITGSGGLTKVSASTFSFSGAQAYTGLTTVNGGTFILGSNASLAGALLNNATVSSNGRIAGLVTNNARLISTGTLGGGLVNAAGATADVRGTLAGAVSNAGTLTLTGATSGIGALTQAATGALNLAGFDTSIGSLAGSGSVALGNAVLTIGSDNGSTSFAGVISGNGGLTKTGTGTFVLTGANSLAGLTTVSQGVLSVRNNAGLGSNAAGTVVNAGAALELQGGVTITGEALTINGTGVNGAGALRNVADNTIWAGTVTLGSDSLITADAGRLDIDLLAGTSQALTTGGAGLIGLANANTAGALTVTGGSLALFGSGNFAGGVNVSAGNLFLQGGNSVNDAAAVTLGSGNLIVAVSETIGSLAGGGTVQIDSGQTLSLGGNDASTAFAGVIFNTGNLAKLGSGTFTVTGTLAHTGTTTITGGTLLSGAANIWQGNGLVTVGTGGTLDLGGFDQSIAQISLAGGTLANGALTGSIGSSGGTIRDISGSANALRAIGGTTTLTGAGSFAQGVMLAGGDVVLQGAGASIADTALVTVDTGTLSVNVSETIGALAGSGGRVQVAAGQSLTTGGSNASTAYAGVLAGSGNVTKTGTGTFTLSGANTLTGAVTVNAGVLALSSGASLAGAVQNAAGFSNAGTVAGLVTNTGTLISSGVLNGGLVNSGSAGLADQLNGAVTNSGLVQLQGVLTGITGFNQAATGTLDLAGFSTAIGSLSGAGNVLLGSATLTLGGSNASTSFGGTIAGSGGLTKIGTGTFTLTSGQTYTGLTTINAGTLTVAAGAGLSGSVLNNAGFASSGLILGSLTNNGSAALSGQINGAVVNNGGITIGNPLIVLGRLTQNAGGSLDLAGFNASLGSLAGMGPIALGSGTLVVGSDNSSSAFSGVISGSGGLQKQGSGTFTLTGINSYSGLTVVNAGTLVIGEGASVGGATGTVGATLAAPAETSLAVAVAASAPIAAEQASMPAAVSSLLAEQVSMPATLAALTADTANSVSDSRAARAGMLVGIDGGLTPASLTSSAERLPLAGGVSPGPERVDLFGDPASGSVSAELPVVTLGEAAQPVAVASTASASAAGRLGLVSDLDNGIGIARLEAALAGGAEAASPVAASLVAPLAPAASAGETAFAGPLSSAVIAGSVLNNASLINNGSILGQLVNSAGATALNNGVIRGLVTNAGAFTSTGTLSGGLSNSGTARISGTLTGDVLNSGSIALTGITSGIAVFQQAATGSLDLAGFDTTIGVLSGAGTIALGNARLTTGTDGVNSLFGGVISGTGALTKTGTGGLILEGDNSYSGGTTIAGGTLQLGNGGTTGSIIGPVLNNGTLIINRSNAYTFAGFISGTGMFVQAGSGTTTLTGANSYSGGTLISGGRLIGSTVSLQGLIQNDAALEFAQAANGVFAGRIGGTGLLDKSGAGLLELTGDSSALRGATTVRAGELRVTGSLAGSATTVLSGATLSGNGTVGGLVARSGSVVSPGTGGLGMLGVNGAIQLQQGSTLRLQIQAPSGSDMLIGNGTMQLGGTAALTNLGGTYAFNSNYLLLQANGGRTGTFDAVSGLGEFGILYRPELVYTANQVLLRMAPNLLTNIVGATPLTANQRSVVSRIDAAVTAGYNPQPLFAIYALPNAQQPGAFDQLSGEVYATMAGVGIEQERLVREAVLGRINAVAAASRETPEWGNGAGAWGQVFGSWGDGERDGNAARYESDRQGFITGIDYGNANSEGSWRIGAFGMHMTSKVSIDDRGSRAEVEQTGGGIYAGVNSGGVSVGMGASVTGVDLTAVRNIALPGFAETNRGRGDGRAVQGFAELSYAIDDGNATYRPFASVAAGSFRLDALTETGGAAALAVRRQNYSTGSITAGADGTVRMGKVQLSGTLAGRFQVGDRDPAAQIALAAAPAQAFAIRGVQLDSFAIAARLDGTFRLGSNADLSLGYTGLIGKDTADHGARATLSVRF